MVGGGVVNDHGYRPHASDVVPWVEPMASNFAILLEVLRGKDLLDNLELRRVRGEEP